MPTHPRSANAVENVRLTSAPIPRPGSNVPQGSVSTRNARTCSRNSSSGAVSATGDVTILGRLTWWRGHAGADSADLGAGEAHPVGVGSARGCQFIGEAIHSIEDVAGTFAFATVAPGLAISLAGLAVTGHRTEFGLANHVAGLLRGHDVAHEFPFSLHG